MANVAIPTTMTDSEPGDGLIMLTQGRRALLWKLAGVEGVHLRSDGNRPWFQPALHPDGALLAGSDTGRAFAWRADGKLLRTFDSGSRKPLYGVDVSPDGSRVLFWSPSLEWTTSSIGQGGNVWAWDLEHQELRKISVERPEFFWSV